MEVRPIDVSIVIVSMNHLHHLKKLLPSIYDKTITSFSYEVIVVDNLSSDGTADYVIENYPKVICHKNSKVNGFGENNNYGVSISKGNYVFICNPDIIFLEGSLENLFFYAINHAESGIICPKLLNSDYSYQSSVRGFHNLSILFSRLISLGSDQSKNKIVNKYLLNNFNTDQIQHVDWAMGAALMLKKEVFLNLNGFDENFFLYVEDEDLCLRAWKMGYKVTYYPNSVMVHNHQRSSAKKINKKTWFHFKSFVYFFAKHKLLFKTLDRNSLFKPENDFEPTGTLLIE